jgi:hypothetical protein
VLLWLAFLKNNVLQLAGLLKHNRGGALVLTAELQNAGLF